MSDPVSKEQDATAEPRTSVSSPSLRKPPTSSDGREAKADAVSATTGHPNDKSADKISTTVRQFGPRELNQESRERPRAAGSDFIEVDSSTNKVGIRVRRLFGTDDLNAIKPLLQQLNGLVSPKGDIKADELHRAVAQVEGIGPRDTLEGLLAVQMVGVHTLAMAYLRFASRDGQSDGQADSNVNRVTKLLRTFTAQMEALNRYRGNVAQPVVVGRVNVNNGGQAIVGSINQSAAKPLKEGRGQ